jgi:hypothetical protein
MTPFMSATPCIHVALEIKITINMVSSIVQQLESLSEPSRYTSS